MAYSDHMRQKKLRDNSGLAQVMRYAADHPHGCWLWPFPPRRPNSYARMTDETQRTQTAHRAVYEMLVGPIPAGITLHHLCGVKVCVNPAHMELLTQTEHNRRHPTIPSTSNATKTHCLRGHEFTPENTYHDRKGRQCKTCNRERMRARYQRDTQAGAAAARERRARDPERHREYVRRYRACRRHEEPTSVET